MTWATPRTCFTAPSGGHDSEGEIDVHARHAARDHGFERRQVVGVDDVSNPLHRDLRPGIELEDAVGLLGPVVVVPHQVRDEAARLAQPLGVGETVVGPPELRLGPLSVFDVGVDPVPFDDGACLVAQRVRTEEKPPILAVVPAQSRFRLSRRFRSHDALPRRRQTVQVLRVDGSRPAPTARLFRRKADEVQIVLVEELGASIGTRRPGQRRNRVDDQLEITLARARGLLGALALVDVRQQHAPANDVAACIAKRKAAVLEPAIDAVRPPESLHDLVWTAGGDRLCEDLDDVRKILGMNGVVRPPLLQLLERLAGVFEDLAIDDFDVTGRGQECDQTWNVVDD